MGVTTRSEKGRKISCAQIFNEEASLGDGGIQINYTRVMEGERMWKWYEWYDGLL